MRKSWNIVSNGLLLLMSVKTSQFVKIPHLPSRKVTVAAVSSEYEEIITALRKLEIKVLPIKPTNQLDEPVASHADMQLLPVGENYFFLSSEQQQLSQDLMKLGAVVRFGEKLEKEYPKDVLYNAVCLNKFYICNDKTISQKAKSFLEDSGKKAIYVKQGYTKCSVCVVDENSIITADPKIAELSSQNGMDVLLIRPGFIQIPKYDTGLIGGCCGKLDWNQMAFTGKLSQHPDGDKIQSFLKQRKIDVIELTEYPLFDIGSIIPICQLACEEIGMTKNIRIE